MSVTIRWMPIAVLIKKSSLCPVYSFFIKWKHFPPFVLAALLGDAHSEAGSDKPFYLLSEASISSPMPAGSRVSKQSPIQVMSSNTNASTCVLEFELVLQIWQGRLPWSLNMFAILFFIYSNDFFFQFHFFFLCRWALSLRRMLEPWKGNNWPTPLSATVIKPVLCQRALIWLDTSQTSLVDYRNT